MYQLGRVKYLFVVPGILWVLAFTIFPLLYSLRLSFFRARMGRPQTFIGLQNYIDAFHDYRFWDSMAVTLIFVVACVTFTVVVGLGLAILFNREMRGQRLFRSLFTMPLFTSAIAVGYLGLTIFHEQVGAVNSVLISLGVAHPPAWFSNIWLARLAVVLVFTWQWTPFSFLVLLAGLQSLPEEIYEAARLDSSSGVDLFRYITLPLIAPILLTVTILQIIETFKMLDIPFSLTSGGPGAATQTYSFYVYLVGLRNFNHGYASALAYILLIIMMMVSLSFFNRMRNSYE